jgi:hypothetical protein
MKARFITGDAISSAAIGQSPYIMPRRWTVGNRVKRELVATWFPVREQIARIQSFKVSKREHSLHLETLCLLQVHHNGQRDYDDADNDAIDDEGL